MDIYANGFEIIKNVVVFVSCMLKVKIQTKIPKGCIARRYDESVLKVKCVCIGKKGIKALVDVKRRIGKGYIVVDEHPCALAKKILKCGVIVLSAEIDDKIIWNIACSDEAFKRLMEDVECELISKERFSEEDVLTFREYTMLKFAFERGFFDSPKGVSLDEIAKAFQCSKSTASETLRRAIRKVIRSYFEMG